MNDDKKQKKYELVKKLITGQNFAAAVVIGAFATLIAAIAHGITVETRPYSYGFAAVGAGIVVRLSMDFSVAGFQRNSPS